VFGDWNSVFRRFSRRSIEGVWWRIFAAMSDDPDFEYLIVDSRRISAAAAKNGSEDQALGRSRGGLSAKMHMAVAVWDVLYGSCSPQARRVMHRKPPH